jgi:hypothetical protein
MGHAAQPEAAHPPTRLVRRKVMKERRRLRSVGCALEEPPVRASEEGGALIWSLVDENRRRTSSV